jgi:hypothetical protein
MISILKDELLILDISPMDVKENIIWSGLNWCSIGGIFGNKV